jgi:hypothetical protein
MSDGFRVDMGALDRAAAGVDGTLDEVDQQSVSDIPHDEAAFGHERLATTVSDFCSRWQTGVDNLTKDGREIAARLTANVKLYRKAEQGIQNTITNGILVGRGPDPGERA